MLEEMKALAREKNSCVPNLFPGAHQGQLPVYAESTLPSLSAVARTPLPSVFSKYSLSKQISINHTPSPI